MDATIQGDSLLALAMNSMSILFRKYQVRILVSAEEEKINVIHACFFNDSLKLFCDNMRNSEAAVNLVIKFSWDTRIIFSQNKCADLVINKVMACRFLFDA